MCQIHYAGSEAVDKRGPTNLWSGNLFRTVIMWAPVSWGVFRGQAKAGHECMDEKMGGGDPVTASRSDRLA